MAAAVVLSGAALSQLGAAALSLAAQPGAPASPAAASSAASSTTEWMSTATAALQTLLLPRSRVPARIAAHIPAGIPGGPCRRPSTARHCKEFCSLQRGTRGSKLRTRESFSPRASAPCCMCSTSMGCDPWLQCRSIRRRPRRNSRSNARAAIPCPWPLASTPARPHTCDARRAGDAGHWTLTGKRTHLASNELRKLRCTNTRCNPASCAHVCIVRECRSAQYARYTQRP